MRLPLVALVLLAPVASAHGFGGIEGGDTLGTAAPLGIPAYLFEEAGPGVSVHYYRIEAQGALRIRLVAPPGREPAELPLLYLFGPGFDANVSTPPDVERPPEAGGIVLAGGERAAGGEPALGLAWTVLLDREVELSGGAHTLALRTSSPGPVALVIEDDAGAWVARFALPGLRDDARAWAGAPAWPALVAGGLGAAAVGALAYAWRARAWSLHALAAFVSAGLCAATGLALATDALRTGVGWSYVGLALVAAALALASTRPAAPRPRAWQRALLAAVALLAWWGYAGATWGPVAALLGALLPEPGEG